MNFYSGCFVHKSSIRQALGIANRLGAAPLAAIVRKRLRAHGAHGIPRGSRTSTLDQPFGLTKREAQLHELLSQRLRNSAIAKRPFLSNKTVENHASTILTKLGVSSRADAVATPDGQRSKDV